MNKKARPGAPRPDLTATAAAQETAHLSTAHINSKHAVLVYEAHVIEGDIERLSAALQGLRRRKRKIESTIAGMQATISRR